MSSSNAVVSPDETLLQTKAKLFTVTDEDGGTWTEIGVGTVSIRTSDTDPSLLQTPPLHADGAAAVDNDDARRTTGASSSPSSSSGSEELSNVRLSEPQPLVARMDVLSVDDDHEVLMSTPLVEDDIYTVQQDVILVWSDPEIGREMALSFNTPEGRQRIVEAIMAFQAAKRSERLRLTQSKSTHAAGAPNGSTGTSVAHRDTSGGSSDGHAGDQLSPWAVVRENLPTLVLATQNNIKRLGVHIRDHETFGRQLCDLFRRCDEQRDLVGKEHIGRIVVALLGPPFNTEGRIMSQLVDTDVLDQTIDIVQFALGRRTPATGYIDAETRRKGFQNPCGFPPAVVAKIHGLHGCQFLKDMLPLFLDEGDAVGASLLGTFLLRFKFALVSDVCRSETCLPQTMEAPRTFRSLEALRGVVSFLHDLSKTIKNSMIPLDPKEELYDELLQRGTLEFLRRAMLAILKTSSTLSCGPAWTTHDVRPASEGASAGAAVGMETEILTMSCDVVAHMLMFLPRARDEMLADALGRSTSSSGTPSSAAATTTAASGRSALFSDARVSGGDDTEASDSTSSGLWRAAVEAGSLSSSVRGSALLDVMCRVAIVSCRSGNSTFAQAAYDMLYSCGVGLLQGVAVAAMGINIHPKRRQVLRYWMEGDPLSGPERRPAPAVVDGGAHAPAAEDGEAVPPADGVPLRVPCGPAMLRLLSAARDVLDDARTSPVSEGIAPPPRLCQPLPCKALHYVFRCLTPLCKEPTVATHPNFVVFLRSSEILGVAKSVLDGRVYRSGSVLPSGGSDVAAVVSSWSHGALGNARATVLSWLAVVLLPAQPAVLSAVAESKVLDSCMALYLQHFGTHSTSPNVVGSNAAHVLQALHHGVHLRKSGCQPQGSPLRFGLSSGSAASSSFSQSLLSSNGGGPASSSPHSRNPFLRSLGRDDGFDSDSTAGEAKVPLDTSLVADLVDRYSAALSGKGVTAHQRLLDKLRHVLDETPEEARQQEEESSRATSTLNADRPIISDDDFSALLAEYGPDAPITDARLQQVVDLSDVIPPFDDHHRGGSAEGEGFVGGDEEGVTNDGDGPSAPETGFLLKRRSSTIRRQRSTSPPHESPDEGAAEGSPAAKRLRADGCSVPDTEG